MGTDSGTDSRRSGGTRQYVATCQGNGRKRCMAAGSATDHEKAQKKDGNRPGKCLHNGAPEKRSACENAQGTCRRGGQRDRGRHQHTQAQEKEHHLQFNIGLISRAQLGVGTIKHATRVQLNRSMNNARAPRRACRGPHSARCIRCCIQHPRRGCPVRLQSLQLHLCRLCDVQQRVGQGRQAGVDVCRRCCIGGHAAAIQQLQSMRRWGSIVSKLKERE